MSSSKNRELDSHFNWVISSSPLLVSIEFSTKKSTIPRFSQVTTSGSSHRGQLRSWIGSIGKVTLKKLAVLWFICCKCLGVLSLHYCGHEISHGTEGEQILGQGDEGKAGCRCNELAQILSQSAGTAALDWHLLVKNAGIFLIRKMEECIPIASTYGLWYIYLYAYIIYHKNQPNVGKYTIHGDGMGMSQL